MTEFQTSKSDFSSTRLVETDPISIEDGEILLEINQFSFTANNITYAVMGEKIRYWQFFPPSGDDKENWGIIPVWGFATIVESKSDELPIGERIFGYFPPASNLKITPSNVSEYTFFDGSSHRSDLPPAYNLYRRVTKDPGTDSDSDKERMLLYPLFVTAFALHDMLSMNDWYGAEQVIIGSASSKTSIGLAYALAEDENAPSLVGLTSERNLKSVIDLGIYDTVTSYDQLTSIDASKAAVIVDMSGNGEMLAQLHSHLGDNMRFCSNVGLTHWDAAKPSAGYIQERSEMFFAPGHIQKRIHDWGAEGFDKKSATFIERTAIKSRDWLVMTNIDGLQGLSDIYDDVCHGKIPPEKGLIIQM